LAFRNLSNALPEDVDMISSSLSWRRYCNSSISWASRSASHRSVSIFLRSSLSVRREMVLFTECFLFWCSSCGLNTHKGAGKCIRREEMVLFKDWLLFSCAYGVKTPRRRFKNSVKRWAFILHMGLKIAINPYIYIFFIIFFLKTNILTICEGYMACHKGTTHGINPASGIANTHPLKDWGTERLHTQEK